MRTRENRESLHGPWPTQNDDEVALGLLQDEFGETHRLWRAVRDDRSLGEWCAARVRPRGDGDDELSGESAAELRRKLVAVHRTEKLNPVLGRGGIHTTVRAPGVGELDRALFVQRSLRADRLGDGR